MKTLVNCTPREFMTQTVKMRKTVEKWLNETGIPEIRKRMPDGFSEMDKEEKLKAIERQSDQNLGAMLWAAMEKDPEGTLDVLGYVTFSDAGADDAAPMPEYLDAVLDMFKNEAVRTFFMLCLRSALPASSEESTK